jgi:hypothetical protein
MYWIRHLISRVEKLLASLQAAPRLTPTALLQSKSCRLQPKLNSADSSEAELEAELAGCQPFDWFAVCFLLQRLRSTVHRNQGGVFIFSEASSFKEASSFPKGNQRKYCNVHQMSRTGLEPQEPHCLLPKRASYLAPSDNSDQKQCCLVHPVFAHWVVLIAERIAQFCSTRSAVLRITTYPQNCYRAKVSFRSE